MEEEWIVTKISASKEDAYVAQPRRLGIDVDIGEEVLVSGLTKSEAVSTVSSIGDGNWFDYSNERLFVCRIERERR